MSKQKHTTRLAAARLALSLAAALLLSASPAAGQGRTIRFTNISLEQGLSQATVSCILQDRTGFIWLGTQDGLNRYDGVQLEVIKNDPDEPGSLSNNWVRALIEAPSGDIWIGTRGGGLNRWRRDRDSFARLRHDPGDPGSLADDFVRALLLDRDGYLWVGTENSGLDRLDPRTGVFEHFRHDPADPASLSNDDVRTLLQDSAGRLWVGTLGGGLNLFLPDTGGFRRFTHDPADPGSLNDNTVRAIVEDHAGELWIATHGGLARLDRESWRFARFTHDPADPDSLSGDRLRVLLEDSKGRLWVGGDSGLNLFDRASGRFYNYRHDPADSHSIGNDRVAAIFEDRGGILWVGTHGGGVGKWDPRSWSFTNDAVRPSLFGSSDVLALTLDDLGTIWLGTQGGGLHRIDRATGEVRRFLHDPGDPTSLSDNRVTAVHNDRQGRLWVGTLVAGLNLYRPASGDFVRFKHDPERDDSLGADGVMTAFEDRQGRFWVGTFGGGVNLFDRASGRARRWRHDPADPTTLSDDRVTSFAQTADGDLWVATLSAGINHFDPETGRFVRLRSDPERSDSLSSDTVMSVFVDPADRLWVGTQVGLNRLLRFDRESGEASFRRYLRRDGLPSDFVYGIVADRDGDLWMSTNNGLSRLDVESETFRNYDTSHGLQSNEFNMNAYHRAADGELFFGGIDGFNAFYPSRIERNTVPPPVVLTRFSRLNQPVRFDRPIFDIDEITLKHTDNVISFEFAALDFTAPEKNRYRCQLEGFDRDWVDLGTRRRVSFTNLDPARYRFRVQASNNDGVWNTEGLTVALVIPPPLWATWWFRGLLAFASVGLVSLFVTLRTRSVRRRNALLQALVNERTAELEEAQEMLLRRERLAVLGELAGSVAHELRNPLGAIKNSAYFLRLTRAMGEGKAAEHLGLIEREIERSNGIITELLDFGRSPQPRFRRARLDEIVGRALAALALPDSVTLERLPCDEPVAVEVDPDQIERILVNLLRNALQAMRDGGRLEVGCAARDGKAVATVADSGPGIPPENLKRIFEPLFTGKAKGIGLGLPVSLRYANLNHGSIEVESEPGQGATFRLVLPLAAAGSAPVATARPASGQEVG